MGPRTPAFGFGTAVPSAVSRARGSTRTRGAGGRGLLGAGRKARGSKAKAALQGSADSGDGRPPSPDSDSSFERRVGKEIDDELLRLELIDLAEGSGS